jgi:acyl dehydratase
MTSTTRAFSSIAVGDELTPLVIDVTATVIVAGAVATRDFMPVHHDRDYANAQGAPDIFMNILSDTGYCSRFLTDWAGPDVMLRRLAIRLGVPVFPGHTLTYTGEVTGLRRDGEHVSGTATLTLPLGASGGAA